MDREIGYYWVEYNGEPMPAGWIGGVWYIIGEAHPVEPEDSIKVLHKLPTT